uniref:Putative alanine dehydrogenase n=1 Tax=candidate division WOR-3 bacterium TaxID=2052148 RepID=A0A7V3ZVV0_UNCW3
MEVLFLNLKDVRKILKMEIALQAVEKAFYEKGMGRVIMPPKVYLFYEKYQGDIRVMPSYLPTYEISGVKVVNVHPNNPLKYKLPSVMATIVLISPKNGAPLAILDGTEITNIRTGAAGGIATKYLARKNASVLSLVGAGVQAETQLLAIVKVRKIKKVKIFDINYKVAKNFQKKFQPQLGIPIVICSSIEECVQDADIISTQTPVREPIVKAEWIKPGTHINAIGADAPGKEELDPEILKKGRIYIDDWEQASHSGEINVPLEKGIIKKEDIKGELGEVICGKIPGREKDDEITIFDSTGLGIQDLVCAYQVYKIAKRKKIGRKILFF